MWKQICEIPCRESCHFRASTCRDIVGYCHARHPSLQNRTGDYERSIVTDHGQVAPNIFEGTNWTIQVFHVGTVCQNGELKGIWWKGDLCWQQQGRRGGSLKRLRQALSLHSSLTVSQRNYGKILSPFTMVETAESITIAKHGTSINVQICNENRDESAVARAKLIGGKQWILQTVSAPWKHKLFIDTFCRWGTWDNLTFVERSQVICRIAIEVAQKAISSVETLTHWLPREISK